MKRLILYFICLPWDIAVWLIILFSYLFWGDKLFWEDGLWCEFKKDSWPMRTWYKEWNGTTFGHGGWLRYNYLEKTLNHELIHVEQFEANMLFTFILAVFALCIGLLHAIYIPTFITCSVVWLLGGFPWAANWLTAYLRDEDFYFGSIHEESAYSQIELEENREKNDKRK
jgi:hypothetical protein